MKRLAPQWWWLLLQGATLTTEQRPEPAAPAPHAWQPSAANAEVSDAPPKKGSSPLVVAFVCVSVLAVLGFAAYQLPRLEGTTLEAANPVAALPATRAKAAAAAAPSAAAVDLLWKAVVSATGSATVQAEQSCRVIVRLVNHLAQASVCAAAVVCGKQVLYGQPKEMTGSGGVIAGR